MPSNIAVQPSSPRLPLKQHLESLARATLQAINARNFDPSTSPWHPYYDPAFEYTTCEVQQNPATPSSSSSSPNSSNLKTWLAYQSRTADTYPEYQIKVLDATCMEIVKKAGFGSVVVNAEVHGIPSGVARAFVMMFDFQRKRDDEDGDGDAGWKAVRFTSMGGQDGGGI